ncbi:MAG: putative molybdenum carrier protein [Limisphaerales bacterium]
MESKRLKIISGGQTGVDRAALDAALALGFPCGGWCPAGRLDEDGAIPDHYPLKELKRGGYKLRTIQNLVDADGTLIFYFSDLEGGTEETVYRCIKLGRPYKLIDGDELSVRRAIELTVTFVVGRALRSLNVAGPRASKSPGSYGYAYEVLSGLLRHLEASSSEVRPSH